MSQVLDDGKTVAFGQRLEELEQMFGRMAVDIPVRIARQGIDKTLQAENVALNFDSGRLKQIKFEAGYEFKNAPTPYPEDWKNFVPLGSAKISGGMHREDFLAYLKAWEGRARMLGAEPVDPGGDLTDRQYSAVTDVDAFADMVVVNMGPSRRAGGGGLWCDGWILFFAQESDQQPSGVEVGRLRSLSAFRDEFNTVARRPVTL